MSTVFRKRGFDAHNEEADRKEKEKKSRTGKLWRYFLNDEEEEDAPLRFLTEEPILFYEHTAKIGGKWTNITCDGEDCETCADGGKSTYRGAWLVVDGREVEIDDKDSNGKKTGKKKIITDQVRLYVRGSTDIAKLDRLSRKFGLTSRPWFANKTGKDTSTSYELDRGEPDELSVKQITNLLAKIPEEMRNHYTGDEEELYDIVNANLFEDASLGEEEEEEDKPKKGRKSKTSKPSTGKLRKVVDEEEDEDEDDDDGVDSGVQRLSSKPKKTVGKKSTGKKTLSRKSEEPPAKRKLFKR